MNDEVFFICLTDPLLEVNFLFSGDSKGGFFGSKTPNKLRHGWKATHTFSGVLCQVLDKLDNLLLLDIGSSSPFELREPM